MQIWLMQICRAFDACRAWVGLLVYVLALVFVLMWPRTKGKAVFASFLGLTILFIIGWRIVLLLLRRTGLEWDSLIVGVFQVALSLVYMTSLVLLLAFVALRSLSYSLALAKKSGVPSQAVALSQADRRSILRRRIWTYVIDYGILSLFCFAEGIMIGLAARGSYGSLFAVLAAAFVVGLVIATLYTLFKDAFAGKSVGKAMTGLRVVDASTGLPIGIGKSMARNWIFLVPFMPLVEALVATYRPDKLRLGDLMAGTMVVRDRYPRRTGV